MPSPYLNDIVKIVVPIEADPAREIQNGRAPIHVSLHWKNGRAPVLQLPGNHRSLFIKVQYRQTKCHREPVSSPPCSGGCAHSSPDP